MKIYNVFNEEGLVVATVDDANLPSFVKWKNAQLKEEADNYHALLLRNGFTLTDPEWYNDGAEFGFRFTSHHPTFVNMKPTIEKYAVQYHAVKFWTPDQPLS